MMALSHGCRIIVINKGGSAVAVTGVGVEFRRWRSLFSQPSPTHPFKSVAIVGSDLPVTIEVNHLANWHLDMAWVIGTGLANQMLRSGLMLNLVTEVQLKQITRLASGLERKHWLYLNEERNITRTTRRRRGISFLIIAHNAT